MPTLTGADYLFGSAIASAFDRARVAVRLLPCGRCGAEGPHWRVVVREGVATAVCAELGVDREWIDQHCPRRAESTAGV